MRADVLEHLAEELGSRRADPLASFTTWEDGRRKLDGMSRGKRWDIDREQRAFERDTNREIRRLQKLRARRRRPEVYRAWHRRYEAANKARRAALRKRRYWKNRQRELAKQAASRAKHRAKRTAENLARYHAQYKNDPERRARKRAYDRARYLAKKLSAKPHNGATSRARPT